MIPIVTSIIQRFKKKKCSNCGLEKRRSEFWKDRTKEDGLQYWCKHCITRSIKIRLNNQKFRKEAHARSYAWRDKNLKAWYKILSLKYSNPIQCQMCGKELTLNTANNSKTGKRTTVHFDHRNGNKTKIKRPALFLRNKKPIPENIKLFTEEKFGLLCNWCNRTIPTCPEKRKQFGKYLLGE